MRVAVIGAGIAGLGCARKLKGAGVEVTVFEKSRGLGGRLATRRVGPYTFDTGATTLTPRESELGRYMATLPAGTVELISRPVYAFEFGRIVPGDSSKNKDPRFGFRDGISRLAKSLADGLDVRLETRVEAISAQRQIAGETYDHIVLSAPTPQALELLGTAGDTRRLPQVSYRPCLSVLLGYATPDPDVPFYAVIDPHQRNPIVWVSFESLKVSGRAPEGHCAVVVQMNRDFSRDHYTSPDERIIEEAVSGMERLFGEPFGQPAVTDVKRWRYSQPEQVTTLDTANPPGTWLWLIGDGLAGGRAELAYSTGIEAAGRILS